MPLPRLPGYRIERLAGRGGFGAVYEARRLSDHVRVAIKFANARDSFALRRLWYEGLALRAVGPPDVPRLEHEGMLAGGGRYLIMEWLREPTLADRLGELRGGMKLEEFGEVALASVVTLARLHDRGYVHADIKPEHIVLAPVGDAMRVRLLDLGLVKPLHKLEPTRARARRGLVVGTGRYLSPEQLSGDPIGVASDVYSLGIVMVEMLVGRRAVDVRTSQAWGVSTGREMARLPPDLAVDPAIEQVVRRCLALRPDRRYKSMRTLRQALARALARSQG